jgi:hypothetical protein
VSDSHLGATEGELLGFRWFTGISQARHWAPVLRAWSGAEVPAP